MKTEFSGEQHDLAYPDGVERHWWQRARNRIIARAVRKLAGSSASVLDVGCGRGVTIKYLREDKLNCMGVEPSPVRPLAGLENCIRQGRTAEGLESNERQRFNALLLLDVIEHIAEPAEFLRSLSEAFPNVTTVIVTVPARQELWSNYDEFYGHHRRYTLSMIEGLAANLGWKVISNRYFFHSLYLAAWPVVRFAKARTLEMKAPAGILTLAHALISKIMMLDFYLLPTRLPGTSILAAYRLAR